MQLNCGYFNAAYRGLANHIIYDGTPAGPRGIQTREILGASFRVNEPMHNILYHPNRDLNYRFMVAEFLWILFGYDDAPSIGNYNKRIVEFSDDGLKMWGAYGPRLQVALPYVLGKLREDPQTRQAVANIWETPWTPTKDVMCTLNVQFIRREDFLNTIVTMRSSDIFLGLPYDFYVFSQIQNLMCHYIKCLPGFLQFNLGSAHMYDRDLDRLGEMCSGLQDISCYGSDRMFSPPPPELAAVFNDPKPEWATTTFSQPWNTLKEVLIHPRKEAFNLLLTDQ
jgi:thymidylate synthase